MQEIDELEKTGGEAIAMLPPLWRVTVGTFFKMLVKCLRALERKLDEKN